MEQFKGTQELVINLTDKWLENDQVPEGFYVITDKYGEIPIAYVKMGDYNDVPFSLEEGESNLKLFRSAPELLKALEFILSEGNKMGFIEKGSACDKIARAAIKRAKA